MTAPSTVPTRSSDTESVIKALFVQSSGKVRHCVTSSRHSQTDRPKHGAGEPLENSGNDHQSCEGGVTVNASISGHV